ncbi:MAG: propionyl-CoA synthetase [Candidatus Thiodiazotropha endolucinida]|uniref:Propionyl-CoA synthetase n=1 Tax=Candidatus Thiodiazotropha taylori TaxID=2792791 RepID=A0A9E4NLL9_9GAMM|nr:propionyl-CoA synthetase [Candidatus Thiodiazotropha sp. (ex Codakia orbicularis)]MCG7862662.1 propionyl-CoA synthetase [Candidatus Thiodiazotropha endolucinida]MCG7874950.1 propionyl-CoA synthetase [Candidatus Thiodiazotropha taylori]MBT3054326.1 propionyl-CoA synthetase [Candidatus Thiodiazotropha sp. (ex Codakia orbicularis)]MCG7880277.1 propionyl-CoA synthetase [Candidatus Thiodiazotropha taylori]
MSRYAEIYQQSLNDPEVFWGTVAKGLHWYEHWDKVLDESAKPSPRWFSGGMFNTCYNALDRHVEAGNGDRLALIYDSPVTEQKRTYSYSELRDTVARLAGVIASHGVGKGDRVIIYMPMIPEAAIAMLACARIGAIHSVVFGGFAAKELATRIDDCQPKMILSASCGIEPSRLVAYKPLLDEAIDIARHKPTTCIIKQRTQLAAELQDGRDFDWEGSLSQADPVDCVPVEATDPLYILYTSGTTGQPKGVVRDNGGHAAALLWSMKNIYNVEAGDVYWAASDVGWVVGHSYIVYGPLLAGCTTVIYEGKPVGTPDPGAFWRMISEYKVKVLFTAPTAFRAIKKEDPQGAYMSKYDIGCMDALFLAGERCDPDTLHWAETMLDKPVVDHWWQTETGWAIAANPMGIEPLPIKAGSPTVSMVGYDVRVLDDQGVEKPAGEMGDIVIKQPLPPACLPTLWNNEQRFVDSYLSAHPGYYLTGDAGYKDEDGYLWIMSRTDDVINVAGHRLSTGQMEEVLAGHADVAECAVIGVSDTLKGQLPLGFVVLKSGVERSADELAAELVKRVREQIGPVAAFKHIAIVKRLPKTRSGKILRGTMVKIADGQEWKMPATIDDPAILDEISSSLQTLGYAK